MCLLRIALLYCPWLTPWTVQIDSHTSRHLQDMRLITGSKPRAPTTSFQVGETEDPRSQFQWMVLQIEQTSGACPNKASTGRSASSFFGLVLHMNQLVRPIVSHSKQNELHAMIPIDNLFASSSLDTEVSCRMQVCEVVSLDYRLQRSWITLALQVLLRLSHLFWHTSIFTSLSQNSWDLFKTFFYMFMFTTNVFGWVTAEVDMGKDPRDHFRNLSGFGLAPFHPSSSGKELTMFRQPNPSFCFKVKLN